ncbi:MAG: hypothetical protein FWC50_00995 [Planctomycetaceae bacterium]|nr:hypothetical protein [Planctomycetaceae bacterium]
MNNPEIKIALEKQQLFKRQYQRDYAASLRLRNEGVNCFIHKCQIVEDFANNVMGMNHFVWFAIDQEGYVGIFESRIPSPIPCVFFDISLDEYAILHDYIEIEDYYSCMREIVNLPAVDERVCEAEEKRGWYLYESHHDDEYYSRGEPPITPRHYLTLPDDVAKIVCKTQYPGMFLSSKIIDVLGYWDKRYGETPSRRLL